MSSGAIALHGTSLVFAGHVQGLASGSPVTIKFKEPVSVRAVRVVARGETPHQERLPDFTGYVEALLLCP